MKYAKLKKRTCADPFVPMANLYMLSGSLRGRQGGANYSKASRSRGLIIDVYQANLKGVVIERGPNLSVLPRASETSRCPARYFFLFTTDSIMAMDYLHI